MIDKLDNGMGKAEKGVPVRTSGTPFCFEKSKQPV